MTICKILLKGLKTQKCRVGRKWLSNGRMQQKDLADILTVDTLWSDDMHDAVKAELTLTNI